MCNFGGNEVKMLIDKITELEYKLDDIILTIDRINSRYY